MSTAVLVESLSVSYGTSRVLNEVSLEVAQGEILFVMGASGGGKTTLLKAIAGLVPHSGGRIEVEGVDVAKDPEHARRAMGFVFQYGALLDYLNVSENVLFGLRRQRRLGRQEAGTILEGLLSAVGLEGNELKMPDELSGGMKKRVALARALAMEPQVLLYDEPTSGLDPVTAYSIDKLIVDTRDRIGATSIVVSHDVNSAMRAADSVVFLLAGEVAYFGTAAGLSQSTVPEIQELVTKARAEVLA
ncbi:MAG: ABC transporter ATP-binding protein [Fimbriimonadaceae bacterium]